MSGATARPDRLTASQVPDEDGESTHALPGRGAPPLPSPDCGRAGRQDHRRSSVRSRSAALRHEFDDAVFPRKSACWIRVLSAASCSIGRSIVMSQGRDRQPVIDRCVIAGMPAASHLGDQFFGRCRIVEEHDSGRRVGNTLLTYPVDRRRRDWQFGSVGTRVRHGRWRWDLVAVDQREGTIDDRSTHRLATGRCASPPCRTGDCRAVRWPARHRPAHQDRPTRLSAGVARPGEPFAGHRTVRSAPIRAHRRSDRHPLRGSPIAQGFPDQHHVRPPRTDRARPPAATSDRWHC